ncbi:PqiC family protein [Methyloradius palustris]|uniref:ABC-type transport auxiliary lipoprotein component domain-containing protein n=1 Tax=Methyloradius palustris TaxID=2778876 RepID=A0A8D5G5U4_9PROT|nr:PqiC family protein [Methyloradius palustris]BCM26235.1 hypothetical protein ZMTM_24940 [Methyloradius palustris]
MKFVKLMLTSVAAIVLLASCATSVATRFYTLSTPAKSTQPAAKTTAISIEVLPVSVPERLKRPQLVISTQGTQLKILEQDRWSSSFNDELRDVFASGIAAQVGTVDVARGGRIANQPIYRIAITLRQLDAVPGDKIQANFGWTITRLDTGSVVSKDVVISCQLTLTKPVSNSIDAVVQGMQAAVADVVTAISANIISLNGSNAAECGG